MNVISMEGDDNTNFDHTVLLERWRDYFTEDCFTFYVQNN